MTNQCHLCGKKYIWEQDLKRHFKTKHLKEECIIKQQQQQNQQQQYQQQHLQGQYQQQQQQQQQYQQQHLQEHYQQQQQQQQQQQNQQQNGQQQYQQQQQQQQYLQQKRQQQQKQQQQQQQDFKFQHPFTCIVSGPTSCGKTYFIVQLLQQAFNKIQPTPQRIIWLYKRWQPLYDVIKATVKPKVEFIKGVPLHLEKDEFLDIRIRNLIILDDLASEAEKDQRVTDLFTEGSHHRNLSVIALNQNLYFSKNPTTRRNSHYMVLFNNPVDRQPIATLARQMYPANFKELIRYFDNVVSQPYGYLLLDLKPTTPETLRMRTNIFGKKEDTVDPNHHLKGDFQTVRTYFPEHNRDNLSEENHNVIAEPKQDYSINTTMPAACDDCGVMFENVHDLQNHVKGWCPEQESLKREILDEDAIPTKRAKYDFDEDSSVMDKDRENKVYTELAELTRETNIQEWQNKVQKYKKQGLSEDEAEEKANLKQRDKDIHVFMKKYTTLLSYILRLRGGHLYTKIMKSVEKYLQNMELERAIRLAVGKYKHFFEEILDETYTEGVEDGDDDDDDDDNDDDDDDDSSDSEVSDTETDNEMD